MREKGERETERKERETETERRERETKRREREVIGKGGRCRLEERERIIQLHVCTFVCSCMYRSCS